MKSIALFNIRGGVGKTSLVFHLAWMYSELGRRVLAVDLDPQANLTAMFVDEDRLENIWPEEGHSQSILASVDPILRGTGDIARPHIESISSKIGLIVGDLGLSRFEAKLSDAWPRCMDRDESAFRVVSSFYRLIASAAQSHGADLVLIDVGPNLGDLNRSAILAADHVCVPLAADLFSLQGLKNLGPSLREWRSRWQDRLDRKPTDPHLALPSGKMAPIGYVVMQHAVRLDRPARAFERWTRRIPDIYQSAVLGEAVDNRSSLDDDPNCLASLRNYRSLMPLAHDARKPMFFLKPADGALSGHAKGVQNCYHEFHSLAEVIGRKIGL